MSKKKAERVRKLFNSTNTDTRVRWEYTNQKAYDFSNDNQLTNEERVALEEQGMPTFTINRISPVVEMLNFMPQLIILDGKLLVRKVVIQMLLLLYLI